MLDRLPENGVRRATEADASRVERLVCEAHGDSAWTDFGMTAGKALGHPDHRIYLATSDGRPVGCVVASSPEYTMLHSLSVLRPFRGRNHATAMIRAAITDAGPDWAISGVVATVAEHDRVGRERFTRLGFRQLPHYVNKGLIVLHLSLDGVIGPERSLSLA